MNSRLEQFINDHREEFDGEEPDNKVWEKIRQQTAPDKKKQPTVVRLYRVRWSAAAAVVLLMAGAAWYINARRGNGQPIEPAVASSREAVSPEKGIKNPDTALSQAPSNLVTNTPGKAPADISPSENPDNNTGSRELDASVKEEMYHYARLVELKHKELKTIEKDEPLLYKQFASDVNKLDSVYHDLQQQLPSNPNREQLLEAMLQNLQLQMGLLNHQLDIIKQINHSKKTAYEKAYKTA